MDYSTLIPQSLDQLHHLEKSQTKAKLKDRVRFVRYLKEATAKTQIQAGALIGLQPRQSQALWQTYRQKGLDGLLAYNNKGTMGKLSFTQITQLRHYLQTDQAATLSHIQTFLADSFSVSYSTGGVWTLCQRLKIKPKTGRPTNVRRDADQAELFKKLR